MLARAWLCRGDINGAVLGLFRALTREGDFDTYIRIAKSLSADEIFRFVSLRTRYDSPGIARIILHAGIDHTFRRKDGETMRLSDLEIAYDAVVAGVRRGALGKTPQQYARSHHLHEDKRPAHSRCEPRL